MLSETQFAKAYLGDTVFLRGPFSHVALCHRIKPDLDVFSTSLASARLPQASAS